jgi:hypothetical protein
MTAGAWLKSSIDYGRELIDSGVAGARSRQETIFAGEPVVSLLTRSAAQAWKPLTVGACLGLLGAYARNGRKPNSAEVLASTLLGATIGLGTGIAWETRYLTGDIARGAMKNMDAVRDAHWLSRNPITYA